MAHHFGPPPTLTVYTRDRKNKYVIPSVFAQPGEELFRGRRQIHVPKFAKTVTTAVDTSELESRYPSFKMPSSVRLAILNLVCELRDDPKIYFNSQEIASLLQMYYAITNYKVRVMTQAEFEDFLVGTLGITNPLSIAGFKRATILLRNKNRRPDKRGIPADNFIHMLSFYLRGSIVDKAELAFKVIDIDQDGLLRRPVEFQHFLQGSFDPEIAATHAEIDPEQPVRETIQYLVSKTRASSENGLDLKAFTNLIVKEPWLINCLVPISCPELDNIAFQSLFTMKLPASLHERT
ncbi:unnamed protein product [Mesocestoides corti]|uniref:EF-hand domain-containing protein n=1 Tax=Mesocestoides corti TaxID=53468 RepID=A0A0R3UFD7_MESCO|nr:unnamed protein product [Mesocestoides corti]